MRTGPPTALFFVFQAEDGIRYGTLTGVQTCALPIFEHDTSLNETVLRGLGELHLRSVFERMAGQFKLEIETRPPRVPYRETIMAKAEGHHRHKKQTGGAGQFGEVYLRIEPLP